MKILLLIIAFLAGIFTTSCSDEFLEPTEYEHIMYDSVIVIDCNVHYWEHIKE